MTMAEREDVGAGKSLFRFLSRVWRAPSSAWESRTIHRICTLVRKMGVETAFVESVDQASSLVVAECSAIAAYFKQEINIEVFRISFSTHRLASDLGLLEKNPREALIASIVIINYERPTGDWSSYIFKSIISQPRTNICGAAAMCGTPYTYLLNNYINSAREFHVDITLSNGTTLETSIYGSFFAQQNRITHRCAHACLVMLINNRKSCLKLIEQEDIRNVLALPQNTIGNGDANGLQIDQLEEVLDKYGLAVVRQHFSHSAEANFRYSDSLYRYIEGACPTLLVFTMATDDMHVVSVAGHTLNTDLWRPEAEVGYSIDYGLKFGLTRYLAASAWVDHFVVHDDNFGPYYCLPVDTLRRTTDPTKDKPFRAAFGISVVEKDVTTLGFLAELGSISQIEYIVTKLAQDGTTGEYWIDYLAECLKNKSPITVRTFIVSRDSYCTTLKDKDFDDRCLSQDQIDFLSRELPDRFWITEISLPDLYCGNKRKLGEVLFSCTAGLPTQEQFQNEKVSDWMNTNWIQIRMPSFALRPSGASIVLDTRGHLPLLRVNNEVLPPEW